MKTLGMKVFDNDVHQYKNDVMNLIKNYNNPLEISSFQHEPSEDMKDLAKEAKDVIYHMNYAHFNMFYYVKKRNIDTLKVDIANANKLNANKVVIHLDTNDPIPQNLPERNKIFVNLAFELLKKINKELGGNITICIENTYSNLEFYKTIIERVRGHVNIGFTYDFGHAKLWSNNSAQEWNDFLKDLHSKIYLFIFMYIIMMLWPIGIIPLGKHWTLMVEMVIILILLPY
jgi:sugar phosphate isomerase/epimerase